MGGNKLLMLVVLLRISSEIFLGCDLAMISVNQHGSRKKDMGGLFILILYIVGIGTFQNQKKSINQRKVSIRSGNDIC